MYYSLLTNHLIHPLNFKQNYKKKLLNKKTTIQNSLKEKNDIALRNCNLLYNIKNEECTDVWNEIKLLSQEYINIKDELNILEIYSCHKFLIFKLFQFVKNNI
jgi:hypothetical protein